MPFNKTDYTKAPFTGGVMFDPVTEETEILYVKEELKEIAQTEFGVDHFIYDVLLAYNSYPDRWDAGEWINQDTAQFCFYYEPMPVEEPVTEESPATEEPTTEEVGAE